GRPQDGRRGAHGDGPARLQGRLHDTGDPGILATPESGPLGGHPVPDIQPFRGLRYRVPDADLSSVLCPPYDVITPSYRDELYARDPRNIVRVVINRAPGDGAYEEAGATFRGWVAAGLLAPDAEPALYLVEQAFTVDGRGFTRLGLL